MDVESAKEMDDRYKYITTPVTLVTLPIYCAFLSVLIKYRKSSEFRTEYFTLLRWSGLADVVSLALNAGLIDWLPLLADKSEWLWLFTYDWIWARVGNYILLCSTFVTFVLVAMVAYSRFTAVVRPDTHKMFWKKYVHKMIGISYAVVAVFWLPALQLRFEFVSPLRNPSLNLTAPFLPWPDARALGVTLLVYTLLTLVTATIMVVCYVAIAVHIRKSTGTGNLSKAQQTERQKRNAALARRLTVIGALLSVPAVGLGINAIYYGIYFLVVGGSIEMTNFLLYYRTLQTVFTAQTPYLVFVLCTEYRNKCAKMLHLPRNKVSTTAASVITIKQRTDM